MSDVLTKAVEEINANLADKTIENCIKFVVKDEGEILIDADGARIEEGEADCTLIANAKTFEGVLRGDLNPAMAVMTGKLKIEGDMSVALKLGALLS